MKWISVDERLPEDSRTWVLIYTKDRYIRMAGLIEDRWESYEGYSLDPSKTEYLPKPTHWMPLPDPPVTA